MDAYALEAKEKMAKTTENLRASLATLRTGRASPSMLNAIEIDYYGSPTPVNQIASISVPEPRQLLIKPYDKNDVKAIVAAINASDLGINPINEGVQIRLMIPVLTEERRKEIVKQARKYAEEAKVAVRNIRRDYMEILKIDDSYSEDLQRRAQDDIQKVTDEAVKNIDAILQEKEKEIMAI
ncbi:MAG: ribosome recycling factor [Bacilli bacterium]|nr:ribosome recycling factor [Bacilli bacterium]